MSSSTPDARRRYVILAEGQFGTVGSKTAMGVIRYGTDAVVAVLDSTQAGRNVRDWMGELYDIPVLATLDEALPLRPTALLLGTAPQGGKIPRAWRATIHEAIDSGLDVVSGLHEFLSDDPEFSQAAATHGVEVIDHRRPPQRKEVSVGRVHAPGKHVILTVGTDCAIGKMSVALELRKAAIQAGLPAVFVATGQTGIMIEGWGVAVDRLISDFTQGTVEWLVEEAEARGDWIFVEGQGSIDHPAYSSVTLGLIHGATPHGMVLVHEPTRSEHHGWEGRPGSNLHPLKQMIRLHEEIAGLVAPSKVVGIALNSTALPEGEARAEIARVAAETGLPVDDPVRFGAERLLDGIRAQLDVSTQALSVAAPAEPALRLTHEVLHLPLRDPFRIARVHGDREVTTVVTSLTHVELPGLEGLGEAYPDTYYGETSDTIDVVLPLLLDALRGAGALPTTLDVARDWLADTSALMEAAIRHHGGAKAGIDIALHDLLARRFGIPVWELLGTSADIPPTDFTIGIDTPELVAERAARANRFPALKIKLGGGTDIETLEAVRAVYSGPIRVDANTGWQPEQGARLIPELVRLGVELIEQPFPAHQIGELRWLQERSSLPIVVDESAVGIDELERLVGVVWGINVKLAKCGGLGPALRMLRRARELGFKTMLGCMEETSIGIAAAATIASLADWVDLDGNLLLADDPFAGLELGEDCRWQLGMSPGLGVRRRPGGARTGPA